MGIKEKVAAVKDHVVKHKELYLGIGLGVTVTGIAVYYGHRIDLINRKPNITCDIFHQPGKNRIRFTQEAFIGKKVHTLSDVVYDPEVFKDLAESMLKSAEAAIAELTEVTS